MIAQKQRLPIVTLLLIAANMIAAFLLVVQPELLDQYGFMPDRPSVQTAFTSLFLHQNLMHLLGNMVFLAAVGASVEMATGHLRFAFVFFVSGLVGVLTHLLLTKSLGVLLVGASGSVAGCAAYYSVRYMGMKVPLAPRISVSVAFVTAVWALLQALGAFVHLGGDSPVSYWSHLGGFASGAVLSLAFRTPDLGQQAQGHAFLDRMHKRSPAATIAACKHQLETHPNDIRALKQLAHAAQLLDERDEEMDALFRLLELTPELSQGPVLARLAEMGELRRLPAVQRMMLSERLRAKDMAVSEALLLSVVAGPVEDPQRPEAMLALAGLKIETDKDQADRILSQLQETYPLHAAVELARRRGWIA